MNRFPYKRLRANVSSLLLCINSLLLIVNMTFPWTDGGGGGGGNNGRRQSTIEEVDLSKTNDTVYELVRRLPVYHGKHKGLARWSRARSKWKADDLIKKLERRSRIDLRTENVVDPPPLFDGKKSIDCRRLLDGDSDEIEKSLKVMDESPKFPLQEESYLEWTKNCSRFKLERGYVQVPLSVEEEEFPFAFSISTYKDLEQTERLLRAIYNPQNLYCIHADVQSPHAFHQALRSIAGCFDNVWMAGTLHRVKWGDASVLMPDLACMKDLLRRHRGRYKYLINLTGQEFPLRTNAELVRIAKIFNGSNDISGSYTRMEMDRVKYIWSHRWSKTYQQTILYNTKKPKEPYTHSNLTFFKGETHAFFSAAMTEYLLESADGRMFFDWCRDTGHAAEHYWNTLNYNEQLNAPGGYTGDLTLADEYSIHPVVRAKNWVNLYDDQWPCHGKVVRGICIFGVKDAAWLVKRPEMFINKFHLTHEYIGYDCLEEWHRNRTIDQSSSASPFLFDARYYENLPTVKYARKS